jgi:hypothetical protein
MAAAVVVWFVVCAWTLAANNVLTARREAVARMRGRKIRLDRGMY